MSLDLNKLANKLDEALSNETTETLTKFLNDKRMENNKEQTAVQLIIQALDIECKSRGMNVNWDMYLEMEKKQRIKDKLELSASLVKNKEQQHETTWIAALDYAIGKMKGLNDLESKDAFEHYLQLNIRE